MVSLLKKIAVLLFVLALPCVAQRVGCGSHVGWVLTWGGTAWGCAAPTGGSGTPGGTVDGALQYKDGSGFGGDDDCTTDGSGHLACASISLGVSPPTACENSGTPISGCWAENEGSTAGTPTSAEDYCRADSSSHSIKCSVNNGSEAQLFPPPTSYTKRSCEIAWAGTGSAGALQSGDDAAADQSCYNKIGVTETIVAVYARSDAGSNTTTVNPTFGSSGTGTTICSGALTAGSSGAYSSSCTVSNASLTDGSSINPVQGGTLTGTSIHLLIVYTVPAS